MFIIGLLITCFSAPVAISMLSALDKMSSVSRLRWLGIGLSKSDVEMVSIIAVVAAAIGICLMVFGIISRRNKAALRALENHSEKTFCPVCRVDTVSSNGVCPICSSKLEKR